MEKQLKIGDLVRVAGKSGKFRYVGKNIVREVKSGRCYSVSMKDLKKSTSFSKIINYSINVLLACLMSFVLCMSIFLVWKLW